MKQNVPRPLMAELKDRLETGMTIEDASDTYQICKPAIIRAIRTNKWDVAIGDIVEEDEVITKINKGNSLSMVEELVTTDDFMLDSPAAKADKSLYTAQASVIDDLIQQAKDANVSEESFGNFTKAVRTAWITGIGTIALRSMKALDNISRVKPLLIVDNAAKLDKLDQIVRRSMGMDESTRQQDQVTDILNLQEVLRRRKEENLKLEQAGIDVGAGRLLKDAKVIEINDEDVASDETI